MTVQAYVVQAQIISDDATGEGLDPDSGEMGWSNDGTTAVASPFGSVPFNSWHYLCGTRNQNILTSLYIDGKLVTTWSGGGFSATLAKQTTIGAVPTGGGAHSAWFTGDIGGVRVYNRVLSATELQQLYSSGG